MKSISLTLRVLSRVLGYPDQGLREQLVDMGTALRSESALSAGRMDELNALLDHLRHAPPFTLEEAYVETFDRGRGTALYLFEHVHGDSRERGPAMVDLVKTYEQAGLFISPTELPDHLGVVLEFASTQPSARAREFLGELSHIVRAIFSALLKRHSPYASVLAAILELAGEAVQAVELPEEPALDVSWEEPLAFDGCSTQGQAKPGEAQPIRITRRPRSATPGQGQPASAVEARSSVRTGAPS
ncbi:MAG: nitrate reductase molybdenum cofactor assembly chaperone [Burkholderiaceae bacterium]